MSRQSATIHIRRSPRDVFAFMDDVSREHEWQPALESAEQEPAGPSAVGTRKSYVSRFMGRKMRNTYVVTGLEPGRRITYQTTPDSTVEATTEIVCEAEDAGTRVTMLVDAKPRGVLKLIPDGVLETASRQELSSALDRLKERLESEGA